MNTPTPPTSWDYLVPRFDASPWSGMSVRVADPAWPTVAVYCPHDPVPWLLGSFTCDADSKYWGWSRDYPTGDGHIISLGRRSGSHGRQYLDQSDQPIDRTAERQALRDATGSQDAEQNYRRWAGADARVRLRLTCGVCALDSVFRSERVQPLVSILWANGIREVTLTAFARRVSNAAKPAGC